MHRTQEDWIGEYQRRGLFWLHDGNPLRPHALLTSGKHSSGFFYSKPITEDPNLLAEVASAMVVTLAGQMDFSAVQRVVGPQTGATKLAEALHVAINHNGGQCGWASPEKQGEGDDRKMVFADETKTVLPDERVLLTEDVFTTGLSVELAAKAVAARGGILLPYVLVIVNRSGLAEVSGRKVVALIDRHMPTWEAGNCPLCRQGSEAIRPKTPIENWERLTAA